MATAYLDPNLNHALLGGAKSRLSAGGSDRTMAGSVDRVLKVFHYFEANTEHSCWSSNIRYGDATDVRVRRDTTFFCVNMATKYKYIKSDTLQVNTIQNSSNFALENEHQSDTVVKG